MATNTLDLDAVADWFVKSLPPEQRPPGRRDWTRPPHPLANPQSREFQTMAQQYGLDSAWMGRLMQGESARDPLAVSPKGAQGLFQLMPSVQQDYGVTDAFDPQQNVPAGMQYMRDLL